MYPCGGGPSRRAGVPRPPERIDLDPEGCRLSSVTTTVACRPAAWAAYCCCCRSSRAGPALQLAGLQLTLLEVAAASGAAVLAWPGAAAARSGCCGDRPCRCCCLAALRRGARAVRRSSRRHDPAAALKFALRMLAMAGFAVAVVAASPGRARRAGARCAWPRPGCWWPRWPLRGRPRRARPRSLARPLPRDALQRGRLAPRLGRLRVPEPGRRRSSCTACWPRRPGRGRARAAAARSAPAALLAAGPAADLLARRAGRRALRAAGPGRGAWPARAARRARRSCRAGSCWLTRRAAFAWRGEVFRLRLESEGTAAWYAARYAPARGGADAGPGRRAHHARARDQPRAQDLARRGGVPPLVPLVRPGAALR